MIAPYIKDLISSKTASAIRKMFEAGLILKAKYGEDNVYDFSIGNPDLDPPEKVLNAIRTVAQDTGHGVHGYMPNAGYKTVRAAMARKESGQQGVDIDFSSIVMTVGAAAAITSVLKALLSPGDEVVVPVPYFAEYSHYVHNHGGKLVEVKTNEDFSIDAEAIAAALNEKTAAVIINSPNNPTGKIYSKDDLEKLTSVLDAHGKKTGRYPYLICDEPYRAIVYDGKEVPAIFPLYKYAVVVTSFAKNLSIPGERIGYICANPANPEKDEFISAATFATRILGFVNAPAFFQKVVELSWDADCDYSSYETRCRELTKVLDNAGLKYARPEGAFYIFCKVPECWGDDDQGFVEVLEKNLVLCAPGTSFGMKGYFRIAYCVSEKTIINSKDAFYAAAHTPKA